MHPNLTLKIIKELDILEENNNEFPNLQQGLETVVDLEKNRNL